jgi:hypothetical protein
MADLIQTSDLLVLAQTYGPELVQQINYASALLKVLPYYNRVGDNVAWAAKAGGALAESYTEANLSIANFSSNKQADAVLPWSFYRSAFHVSGPAMAMAASPLNPAANVGLWADNLLDCMAALSSTVNVDLYTGTGASGSIIGLEEAIGSVTNTYAGIDRSVGANAYWRPYVADPGVPTAITIDAIRKDIMTIKKQSGFPVDFVMVSPDVLRRIAALFDASKQYVYEVVRTANAYRGEVVLDGGIGGIRFDGAVIIDDKDCPDSEMFYINSRYLTIARLPFGYGPDDHRDMVTTDGIEQINLPVRMHLLGKDGDSDRAFIKSYLQLQATRPNSCGTRYNVAIS